MKTVQGNYWNTNQKFIILKLFFLNMSKWNCWWSVADVSDTRKKYSEIKSSPIVLYSRSWTVSRYQNVIYWFKKPYINCGAEQLSSAKNHLRENSVGCYNVQHKLTSATTEYQRSWQPHFFNFE